MDLRASRPSRDGQSSHRQHHGLRLYQEDRGHTLSLPVPGEPQALASSGVSQCVCTRPILAVFFGQSRGRFSVSSGPSSLGFSALSSNISTNLLSVSGQTGTNNDIISFRQS